MKFILRNNKMKKLEEFMTDMQFISEENYEITTQPFTFKHLSTLVNMLLVESDFDKILIITQSEDLSAEIISYCNNYLSDEFHNQTKDVSRNRFGIYATLKNEVKRMVRAFPLIEPENWLSPLCNFVNDTDKILLIMIDPENCKILDDNRVKYINVLSLKDNISYLQVNNYIKDNISKYKYVMKHIIQDKALFTLDGKKTYHLTDDDFKSYELVGQGEIVKHVLFVFSLIPIYNTYETQITLSDDKTIIFPEELYIEIKSDKKSLYDLVESYFND